MNLHRRPLFPIALGYIAGIVCAVEWRTSPGVAAWFGGMVILLAAVVPTSRLPRSVLVIGGALFFTGLVTTSFGRIIPANDVSHLAEGKMVYLTGVIASDPEPRGDGSTRFAVRVDSVRTYAGFAQASGRTMASIYRPRWGTGGSGSRYTPFHSDRVRIHGRLRVPGPSANPHSGSYADFLARRRIYCTISASDTDVRLLGPGVGVIGRSAAWFKSVLTARVRRHLPDDRGNLLLGVLLGNYAALSLSVQSAFMRTGTMHLLAASGYNCGVIVLIFRWILQRLTLQRAWMHVALILVLWGFAVLAGAGPSIVRATIMMTVFLCAYLLWRAADMLNTVLLAAMVILVANPFSLYDVGFQLSFAAVLAIILTVPLMEASMRTSVEPNDKRPAPDFGLIHRSASWVGRNILGAVLLSVAATVGTAPITAYYFNYVSVVSILANAMVAFLVVALTVFGMLAIGLGSIPLVGPAAVIGCRVVAGSMLGIVTELSSLSWSSCSVRSPGWGFMLFYYVIVLAALEYAHRTLLSERRLPRDESGAGSS